MAASRVRLANEAWEALYRAQVTIMAELSVGLANADQLHPSEYSVLYALSNAPGGLRITELGDDVLITQAGMSRLIARLETRGFVERTDDPDDRRACRICLSPAGSEIQRRVGAAHARDVAAVMSRALTREQLATLRDLSRALLATTPAKAGSRSRSSEVATS